MAGMTCGNQMMWRKVPTCEQDEAEEMKIKSLEDRVMNLSVVLTQLENKLQQSLDVSTVPAAIQATTMNQDLEISTGGDGTTTAVKVYSTTPTSAGDTTQDITTTPKVCNVVYESKCFTAYVYDNSLDAITLDQAQSLCQNKLADIDSTALYTELQNHLRTRINPGWGQVVVWTGMTYENGTLLLRSGEPAPSLPDSMWQRFEKNLGDRTSTKIVMDVDKAPSQYQGIYNIRPGDARRGAICES
ncbi:uncharacterized protein LOC120329203 [Styela clava]